MIAADEFRGVMGHFATGVALVTASGPGGPAGMACNSVTSVSLDPPLVAVCPSKTSETWPQIRRSRRFVINLVAREHASVVRAFAGKGGDRFASGTFHLIGCGPALDGALGRIECELDVEHDAGDHWIAVARVVRLEADRELEPLVFFRGAYGSFAAAAAPDHA